MMKKLLVCFISLFFFLLTLSACKEAPGDTTSSVSFDSSAYSHPDYMKDPDNIDPATALKLREDFLQYLIDKYGGSEWRLNDIWVSRYLGNYSGCEVVYMGSPLLVTGEERNVEIARYTVFFPSGEEIYAHKYSMFYTIKEAFDVGLINKADVYDIGKQVDKGFIEKYPNF